QLTAIAERVFGSVDEAESMVALIDLAIRARRDESEAPLVPARYHLLVRALEGAFACLSPDHTADHPRLSLARFEHCPACSSDDPHISMFELGVCRRCGTDYVLGELDADHKIRQAPHFATNLLFLLVGEPIEVEDEDELALEGGESGSDAVD